MGKTLYRGKYQIIEWPIAPIREFEGVYIPLEQMSPSNKELFEYHPDKAKQLLADAGYPNGFKSSLMLAQASVDTASVLVEMWAKIGVDVALDVRETAALTTLTRAKKAFEQMTFVSCTAPAVPFKLYDTLWALGSESNYNYSRVNDPKIEAARDQFNLYYFDVPKRNQLFRDLLPYIYDQVYVLQIPKPYSYVFWWPWLKEYNGELTFCYVTTHSYLYWVWIDQALREQMTGRK